MHVLLCILDYGYGHHQTTTVAVYTNEEIAQQALAMYTEYFGGFDPMAGGDISYYLSFEPVDILPLKPVPIADEPDASWYEDSEDAQWHLYQPEDDSNGE